MRSKPHPSELATGVASEVRAEMARQRLSQGAVADRMGVSQAAISRRIVGQVPFDLVDLAKIADVLGLTPTALIERAEHLAAAA